MCVQDPGAAAASGISFPQELFFGWAPGVAGDFDSCPQNIRYVLKLIAFECPLIQFVDFLHDDGIR